MIRSHRLALITGTMWLAAASAFGATATFTPVGPTTVSAGSDVVFTVSVASPTGFDAADMIIGSNDATDVQFVYSASWTAAFATVTTLSFDNLFYAQDVFAGGNNPTSVGTSLVVGTLTLNTVGMANGNYSVQINSTVDGFSTLKLGGVGDSLNGSAAFSIGCTVNADCDDGLFCNGTETCVVGSCTAGVAPDCTVASDQCNVGVCNELSDTCSAQPINEGLGCNDADPCTEGDICTSGNCGGLNIPRITLTLESEGLAPAVSAARDVTTVTTVCAGSVTDTRVVQGTFVTSGQAAVVLENVDPLAAWINVREAHTLSRVKPLVFGACNQATVSLIGLDRLNTGDLTGDGLVDIEDLSVLASGWNAAGIQADLNGDGQQNAADLTLLLANLLLTGDALDGCVP